MRLLLLDRDGVINEESDDFIKSPEEWRPLPGAMGAISRANQLGFQIVVVSNQSGLGRQLFSIEDLNRIHNRMLAEAIRHGGNISAVFFCPHLPDEGCRCRKPSTGLFESIEKRLGAKIDEAYYVGDRLSDIKAAQKIGALPMLVKTSGGLNYIIFFFL
ncbi:MAG: D-glycero-beta-D-manno-heptose 1,7-bisphosphate 7-phosphatase, partial [Pseudomonadota bacterium]